MTKKEANKLILKIRDEMYEEIAWYIWNHCHDEEMAKDILQEIFLEVCRNVEKLAVHECYRGWVYKTAKYKLMKMKALDSEQKKRQMPLEDIENMEFSSEDEHDFLVFNEYSHILSSEKIELLKDYYYTGKTIEDIAEEKGKTTGAVKMQLKRIREKIKNFLKETDNEKESGFN